jgi:DNA mismatch repair protein MutL
MALITLLPDSVINQIAAGEVLENPASAVKELIENAIDAGASEIRVEIERGGFGKILIEDDGRGMNRADAKMCLERHATSKIRCVEDLERLMTLGFRGEAMAAISSVCKLVLRTSDGIEGTELQLEGGALQLETVCARNRGTTLEIKELFFNTPARLKFQKSAASSRAAILKVVEIMSLAYPDIHFTLVSGQEVLFRVRKEELRERALTVLGSFAHEVESWKKDASLKGFLARPEEGASTRRGQMLFINQRPIVSPLISKAVKEGFGTRMQEGLFPRFLLFLTLPPSAVDVNVHPQKREVRFQEEGFIFQFVKEAVNQALGASGLTPSLPSYPWEFTSPLPSSFSFIAEETHVKPLYMQTQRPLPFQTVGQPIAVLGDFLLVEEIASWFLLDVPGALARLLFEGMKRRELELQPLLIPLELELPPGESAEKLAEELHRLGVEARSLSHRIVGVDAIPARMEMEQAAQFALQLSHDTSERGLAAALTKSCRASKQKRSLEEASEIWQRLGRCQDGLYDPLGRKLKAPILAHQWASFFKEEG